MIPGRCIIEMLQMLQNNVGLVEWWDTVPCFLTIPSVQGFVWQFARALFSCIYVLCPRCKSTLHVPGVCSSRCRRHTELLPTSSWEKTSLSSGLPAQSLIADAASGTYAAPWVQFWLSDTHTTTVSYWHSLCAACLSILSIQALQHSCTTVILKAW